jgi:hypothetical protein
MNRLHWAGKTDAAGQGRVAYLSREAVRWLWVWLESAKMLAVYCFTTQPTIHVTGSHVMKAIRKNASNFESHCMMCRYATEAYLR